MRTQRELVSALKAQGIPATQATVSRDITELGLTKVDRSGSLAYALPIGGSVEQVAEERLSALLGEAPLEISAAGAILVLKTLPGSAHAIAASLDRLRLPEVVGTVAGDDTLFVAVNDHAALRTLRARFRDLAAQKGHGAGER
jgi:transcriptional regulator of arginine metabolism